MAKIDRLIQKLQDLHDSDMLEGKKQEKRHKTIIKMSRCKDMRAIEPLYAVLFYGANYGGDYRSNEDFVRTAAVEALAQIESERVDEILIKALGNQSKHLRKSAAEALYRRGVTKWKPIVLGDDMDWTRLRDFKDSEAEKPLMHALGSTNDRLRAIAVMSLGHMCAKCAAELIPSMLYDSNKGVKYEAITALVHMKDPRTFESMLKATSVWSDYFDQVVPIFNSPEGIAILTKSLFHTEKPKENVSPSRNHGIIAGCLARLGQFEPLEQVLVSETFDYRMVGGVAWGLRKSDHPRAVELLISALGHPPHGVQRVAIASLGRLGVQAFDHLMAEHADYLNSHDQRILYDNTIEQICKIKDPRIEPALRTAIKFCNGKTKNQVYRAMGSFNNRAK